MENEVADVEVNAKGLYCPIPILRLAKALAGRPAGTVALLFATDPATPGDVETFCREGGHALLSQNVEKGVLSFRVRKA